MWFINKNSGIKWDVSDSRLIERLENDPDYSVIDETPKEKPKKEKKDYIE